jgi:hypothetical protein
VSIPVVPLTSADPVWYRGDCHVHAVHSDGELTPAQVAAEARAAGLDFIATTEHNTTSAHGAWEEHAGPDLLVVLGLEVTTVSGHWLALGVRPGQLVDWHYDAQANVIDRRLEDVHRVGALCVAAHPYAPYPTGTFEYPLRGFDALEVWNGLWTSDRPWNADNERAYSDWGHSLVEDLGTGSWRPAIGNSDTHLAGQVGTPQTVVMASGFTVPSILAGLKAGHSWIAGSATIDLSFRVATDKSAAGIGQRLQTFGGPAVALATVRGVPAGVVILHSEHGPLDQVTLSPDGRSDIEYSIDGRESKFLRLEVRQPNGQLAALTNPIFLTGA